MSNVSNVSNLGPLYFSMTSTQNDHEDFNGRKFGDHFQLPACYEQRIIDVHMNYEDKTISFVIELTSGVYQKMINLGLSWYECGLQFDGITIILYKEKKHLSIKLLFRKEQSTYFLYHTNIFSMFNENSILEGIKELNNYVEQARERHNMKEGLYFGVLDGRILAFRYNGEKIKEWLQQMDEDDFFGVGRKIIFRQNLNTRFGMY